MLLFAASLLFCSPPAHGLGPPDPEPHDPGPGETKVQGVVFVDANGNGTQDAHEVGLAGVRVSDGRAVVTTDDKGRYEISIEEQAVIFLTKPAGFAAPIDEHNLPRFYYVHRPEGSPAGLRYPGFAPTGPLPDSLDFSLRPSPEPKSFRALLFADPQPQSARELDHVRDDVLAELIGTDARFGMTLGDILFDDLSLFPRYARLVGALGIPWHNVPGNHDMNLLAADDAGSLETFQRWFGPPYYAFEVADAVFFVLDNIEYAGRVDGPDGPESGGYIANLGTRQLDWFERELAHVPSEKLVFLAMHAPLATRVPGEEQRKGVNTQDRQRLLELLAGRPNLYAVAGHTHTNEHVYLGEDDGFPGPGTLHHHILATVSGSWWSGPLDPRGVPDALQTDGTPNGWHVLQVDGTRARVDYRAAGRAAEHQMRTRVLLADASDSEEATSWTLPQGALSTADLQRAWLSVNLFDGGPRSAVHAYLEGRPPIPLRRRVMDDPFVASVYARAPEKVKSWVEPEPCTHLFLGALPNDLAPGVHAVRIEARDEFGRAHHGHALLEVDP